jgi:hypothetical protein
MMSGSSLYTLKLLEDHVDFMQSLKVIADMGAGEAHDSLWWANAYILDDNNNKIPLKLKVHSFDIDTAIELPSHPNIFYSNKDFNNTGLKENSIDLVWSHNSFQCSKNPLATLAHWWHIMRKDAMLCLTIPNNFQINYFRQEPRIVSSLESGIYFNYTPASLIMMLASSGFDCLGGHFKFSSDDNCFRAAVYKTDIEPQNYVNWYELLDKNLLPLSVSTAIKSKGHFKDSDIVVEWIDHSIYNLGLQ